MDEKKSNQPFYDWVPRPVGILILMLMFVPPTFSGGAYLCNLSEMSSGLGLWSEDVQMASFITSIGMCLFPPFMIRFLQISRPKQTYQWCFAALIPLNYICASTSSLPVLFVACFITGFIRVIVMLNCTFTIAPYLTGMDTLSMFTMKEEPAPEVQYQLERKRTMLMPVLYFFILIISQLSNIVMAWFAYEYRWQDAYYVVVGMLLVAILLVLISMPAQQSKGKYCIEWAMVPEMILMATALIAMSYVFVYGKTLDWFDEPSIRWSVAVMLVSTGAFILIAVRHKSNYYLPLEVFAYRNVWMSMILFLLMMVFNSASIFVGTFAKLTTPINNLHSAMLSGWAIAGCVCGLVLSILLVLRKVKFRTVFAIGFILMAGANIYMYFQYQSVGLYSNMAVSTVLNYTGLLMLYSLIAAWGMKSLPSRYLVTFVFLMIWMRNAIAPVVGSSIYSNWLNYEQQYYVTRLAQNVDAVNPISNAAATQTQRIGLAGGKSTLEASQLSATSLKGTVLKQATIVAMKDITGETIILILATVGIIYIFPYHKRETT